MVTNPKIAIPSLRQVFSIVYFVKPNDLRFDSPREQICFVLGLAKTMRKQISVCVIWPARMHNLIKVEGCCKRMAHSSTTYID